MRPLRSVLVLATLVALPSGCAEEAAPIPPELVLDASAATPRAGGEGEGSERGGAEGAELAGAARLVHPASGTTTTTSTPLLRWTLPEGATGARVLVCADRACTAVEQELRASGTSARPTRALVRGLHYVRVTAIGPYGEVGPSSSTVPVRVRTRTNDVDAAWGATPDLDGDGFADLVTTATGDDGLARVVVYRGSAAGLPESPSATLALAGANALALSTAGDVDGDGLADLVVASADAEGHAKVAVHLGSRDALVGRLAFARDAGELAKGGQLAPARAEGIGDVNGDGLADVAFLSARGALVVVRGRLDGEAPADATIPAPAGQRWTDLAPAGDVDGDGFADVVAMRRGEGAPGAIDVLRGSPGGLLLASTLTPPPGSSSAFGVAFAPAGDVDGDGYADVAVAEAPYAAAVRVHVYAGSAAGLAPSPTWTAAGPAWAGNGTPSLAPAGDVDGDGFDDLLLGVPERLFGVATAQPLLPRAALFRGSAAGLAGTAAQTFALPAGVTDAEGAFGARVAGLGDVDGDGFADLLLGVAQSYPPFFPAVGARRHAFLYRGAASGTPAAPSASFAGAPGDVAFGRSPAAAR